ncbi:MAG: MATE family efflux transporter [Clostridium sp.]|nr:MATE family efflux transporter [Clostridium sp.]
MKIQLSDHFTFSKLLRFTLPSITMMVFTSIYSVVDGLFVSNYVGKDPYTALNLIWPLIMGMGALGFMMGSGGSAIVAKTLGEGKSEDARRYFSMVVYVTIIGSLLLSAIGLIFIRPISIALGSTEELLPYSMLYGRILLISLTFFMLQNVFQSFFATAEKPKLGLLIIVIAGVSNMILDYVFIVVFQWGLAGAAIATAVSQVIGGCIPLFYFLRHNSSLLRLVVTRFELRPLWKACTNGSSELMTNLSSSLVNILYNLQLMKLTGQDGVAAFGTIMYVFFIFIAIYIGYAMGCAPLIGYHYGAGNHKELKNLLTKSLVLMGSLGVLLTIAAEVLAAPLSKLFVGYDPELYALTCHAFRLYAFSFLVTGFNIYGSAFFTALNNGGISVAISFLRTLLLQVAMIYLLPIFFDLDGIWLAVTAAECLTLVITIIFLITQRKHYHYA